LTYGHSRATHEGAEVFAIVDFCKKQTSSGVKGRTDSSSLPLPAVASLGGSPFHLAKYSLTTCAFLYPAALTGWRFRFALASNQLIVGGALSIVHLDPVVKSETPFVNVEE
jgi:hypothetical protein